MGDLNRLTAAEATPRIERREITSEELVRDCLVRTEGREEKVNAWAYIDPDRAIDQALLFDSIPRRSRLHGIPAGVKDVIKTAEMPTTHGSAIYRFIGCGPSLTCHA